MDDATSSSRWSRLAFVALLLLPCLLCLLRALGHPVLVFDDMNETHHGSTAAREWLEGRFGYAAWYQVNTHQGSLLLDPLVAMSGYTLFGDRFAAWLVVPLLYLLLFTLGGTALCWRLVGRRAASLFPLLLAAAPLMLKDGLVSISGGHAPAAMFVTCALACAAWAVPLELPSVEAPELSDGSRRRLAWASGLLLGLGCWYVRTVAVGIPAVLWILAVSPGARKPRILRFVAGSGLFLVLLSANLFLLSRAQLGASVQELAGSQGGEPSSGAGVANVARFAVPLMNNQRGFELVYKVREGLGTETVSRLFGQPGWAQLDEPSLGRFRLAAGVPWALCWLLWIPVGVLLRRNSRAPPVLTGLTLATGLYFLGYVFTRLRIEGPMLEPGRLWETTAVRPAMVRYLLPLLMLETLGLALTLGLLARGGAGRCTVTLRRVGWVVVAVLLGVGGAATAVDLAWERRPLADGLSFLPFRYETNFYKGHGPPRSAHQVCDVEDSISRANHLRASASFHRCQGQMCVLSGGPETLREELAWAVQEAACPSTGSTHPLGQGAPSQEQTSEEDARFVAHGMGMFLADELGLQEPTTGEETFERVWSAAMVLSPQQGEDLLLGLVDRLARAPAALEPVWHRCRNGEPGEVSGCLAEFMALYCRVTPWGARPLCPIVGVRLAAEGQPAPSSPADLFGAVEGWSLEEMDPEVQGYLVQGAGRLHGFVHGPSALESSTLEGWPAQMEARYRTGWARGQRHRWRGGGQWPPAYLPEAIP